MFLQDSHFALRLLKKNPGFTSIAVVTLALGLGATTTIFSVVNSVLLRPLPYQNQDRLLRVEEQHPGAPGVGVTFAALGVTYATFLDLERQGKTIEMLLRIAIGLSTSPAEASRSKFPVPLCREIFFGRIGQPALAWQNIRPEDDQAGGNSRVVVLSYALWQSRFGGDTRILGQTLRVNAEPFTVIGVMPQGFHIPQRSEMWSPLVPGGNLRDNRRAHLLTVLVDRKRGQLMGGVQGEVDGLRGKR